MRGARSLDSERRGSWPRATLIYILALCLLALVSVASFLLTDSIVHEQEMTARTVNVSGRQRMLSQRVAWLCLELSHDVGTTVAEEATREADRAELRTSIARMEGSRAALIAGSTALGIAAPRGAELHAIYFDEPYRLDARVRRFLAAAQLVVDAPDGVGASAALAEVESDAREPLLNGLIAAVTAYEEESDRAIHRLRRVLAGLTCLMLVILVVEALLIYRPLFRRLEETYDALVTVARTDPLTGSLNRRSFLEQFSAEFARARRTDATFAVLLLDIDHFKRVNDTYGHATGDRVIKALVKASLRTIREYDLLGRMGGEEFAIVLPGTGLTQGMEVAERLRAAIATQAVEAASDKFPVTVSVGLAMTSAIDKDGLDTLNRADVALYAAKQAGRNRVSVAE